MREAAKQRPFNGRGARILGGTVLTCIPTSFSFSRKPFASETTTERGVNCVGYDGQGCSEEG